MLDVTDNDSIHDAAAEIDQRHGRLDVLVNNAAITAADGARVAVHLATLGADGHSGAFVNDEGPVRW
nr:hypothetical protein [Kibdelosporangium sp. MJ126-NF4]CTQ95739.1 hypothetical protein [Kibdelosporangium sp. MJ126-NF4]